MPDYSNGLLPDSVLAPITICANGERGRLRRDAAAAFLAMNAESRRRFGVVLRGSSARTTYRDRPAQDHFWFVYQHGGAEAARPYTSNHGYGLAIDLATTQMRQIVDAIGEKYGWAKRWSDAPKEWWHLRWQPGNYPAVREHSRWYGYTPHERRWIGEYDRLCRTHQDPGREEVLRRAMTEQRKRIWRAAQPKRRGGDGRGWSYANRRNRYQSLFSRSSP